MNRKTIIVVCIDYGPRFGSHLLVITEPSLIIHKHFFLIQ